MRITFFDVEYANAREKAICRIGLLSRDAEIGTFAERLELLIDPECPFDECCVRIHGITAETVKGAHTFPQIWARLRRCLTDAVVVGHNVAQADLDALYRTLNRYGIPVPEIYYICTYELARALLPAFAVSDYSLESLCGFFGIPRGGRGALYEACACADLLDRLVKELHADLDASVKRFSPETVAGDLAYLTDPALKRDIHGLYGVIRGLALDAEISESERQLLCARRESLAAYAQHGEVADILSVADLVLADGCVTAAEVKLLQRTVRRHLDTVSTSAVTLALQVLNGILEGMLADECITQEECDSLLDWLYENNYLAGHDPFDPVFAAVERVLADGVLSADEATALRGELGKLLAPVEELRREVLSLRGKRICLTGNFVFGERSAVERYIRDRGGIPQRAVDAQTDMVVMGGTAPLASRELRTADGMHVVKESDVILPEKSFGALLFELIDAKGMTDAEVYNRAGLPRQIMSKIRCNDRYLPAKISVCAFALALELDVAQTKRLLGAAGYALSRSFLFDRIIEEEIQRKNYSFEHINQKLADAGLPCFAATVK